MVGQIDRYIDRCIDTLACLVVEVGPELRVGDWLIQKGRQVDRQIDRLIDGQIDIQIDRLIDRYIDRCIDTLACLVVEVGPDLGFGDWPRQKGRQIDRYMDRWIDRQIE